MLGFTNTTGYAVQALVCLASCDCPKSSTAEIAKCSGVPQPYLCKIINLLTRKGLIVTRRGVGGGIKLARAAEEITLFEIVVAIEGERWASECLLGYSWCANEQCCPTHSFWKETKEKIKAELQHWTLADVIKYTEQAARK
ncbi:MAG: RrF2 family transcriptional regulator [Verrucomicrobiia bacterium]|jgi:Rrf2 family protein